MRGHQAAVLVPVSACTVIAIFQQESAHIWQLGPRQLFGSTTCTRLLTNVYTPTGQIAMQSWQ